MTPSFDTKLNLLATIPSKESESPINAMIIIKVNELKLLGV